MKEFLIFWDGKWVCYTPLPGIDPSFTESTLRIGSAVYAKSLAEGKTEYEAHCEAERAMFDFMS
jgi:hypothetical protein